MQTTARHSLPLLSPGQAQKEVFHNESIQLLDSLVAAAVEGPPLNDPPPAPVDGDCYIVGDAPTSEWTGHAKQLASFTSGGWRFVAPVEGMLVWVASAGSFMAFVAGEWESGVIRGSRLLLDGVQLVGPQAAAIADPTSGATVDSESRAAISSILSALRQHGLIAG